VSELGPPTSVSASGVIDYATCPKRFYWSSVRPLPRFSGPAARIGTEVHRWIERRSVGQGTLIEPDEVPDLTAEELAGEPGKVDRLRQAFLESRFAGVVPRYTERAFLLSLDGSVVGGRIDAIFGEDDGPVGGRRLEDRPQAGGRRPARIAAARHLRTRVRGDLGTAAGGPHAHVPVSGQRRGGLALHGRPRPRSSPRRRVARRHRARRVRANAGSAVPVLRLPLVLRRGTGVARADQS
jgi:hypothetical protein